MVALRRALLLGVGAMIATASEGQEVGTSCQNLCGQQNKAEKCWCDAGCFSHDDCCDDLKTACPAVVDSCAGGHCGKKSGGTCWCDPNCYKHGDCCDDYTAECVQPPEEEEDLSILSSCFGQCNKLSQSGQKACWCDTLCEKQGDCCPDKITHCPIVEGVKQNNGLVNCPKNCACLLDDKYCCGKQWDKLCEETSKSVQCTAQCDEPASCAGVCAEENKYHECWCDKNCAKNNDCCPDYNTECKSLHTPNETVSVKLGTSECAADADCDATAFCAMQEGGSVVKTCQAYKTEGQECAGIEMTPSWEQMRCLASLECDYGGKDADTVVGVCRAKDVCTTSPCASNQACVPSPVTPYYTCSNDVCDPNPCDNSLLCVPDPKACAMALVCPQYKCTNTQGEEQEQPLSDDFKIIFVAAFLTPCGSDDNPASKMCLSTREPDGMKWEVYPYPIKGLKWEPNFEYKLYVNEEENAESGQIEYTLFKLLAKVLDLNMGT